MPCASNPENDFSPGDTEAVILRKILSRLCTVGSGGSGGGVSQAYVDARDAATLASANANAVAGDAATLAAAMSSASALYVLKSGDTMTGALLLPNGAVGAPSLSHVADANTGLWFPAADTIAFSTAGAEGLRILSTGNVGIGTSSSGSKVTIMATGAPSAIGNVLANANAFFSYFSIADYGLAIGVTNASPILQAVDVGGVTSTNLSINPYGGNVGVGIVAPLAKLHITPSASGTDYFRIDHSDGTPRLQVGVYPGLPTYSTLWLGNITPSALNYSLTSPGTETVLNGSSLSFAIGGNQIWTVSSAGHWLAITDNTNDIGASGAARPGNVFVAGKVTIGSATALITSSVAMNNGAAAALGTITNAPTAGNPTKWIPIDDNGTTRYIPAW